MLHHLLNVQYFPSAEQIELRSDGEMSQRVGSADCHLGASYSLMELTEHGHGALGLLSTIVDLRAGSHHLPYYELYERISESLAEELLRAHVGMRNSAPFLLSLSSLTLGVIEPAGVTPSYQEYCTVYNVR